MRRCTDTFGQYSNRVSKKCRILPKKENEGRLLAGYYPSPLRGALQNEAGQAGGYELVPRNEEERVPVSVNASGREAMRLKSSIVKVQKKMW